MSIEVSLVTKSYGAQKALDNVSFSAEKGQIIGFLGPNGAGKSTMMKILTGYITPDSGSVSVNGINVLEQAKAAQQHIGYLPEHNPLYKDMYVKEYLQFQASIFKVDKSHVANCIARVGLTEEAHKKIHQLSKGYQQRVGIAAAILHNPAVLILDEPTTGLDPNQLVGIRALIKTLGKDKTVLFSTHIMQEVQAICDRVIILKKGNILVDKPLTELQNTTEQVIDVAFSSAVEKETLLQLSHIKHVVNTANNSWQLVFATKVDKRAEVFDFAQMHQLKIVELSAKQKNLETLFREVTNT